MNESSILPSELGQQDYLELLKIQSSKACEDRPLQGAEGFKKMAQMFGN